MRPPVDEERIRRFFEEAGRAADRETRVYLTGGATAVLQGWRASTIDLDLKIIPEADALLRALPGIKESLRINVELASPDLFIPELPGWADRSSFVAREGKVSFYHYDFYAQALAKLERGHTQDLADVGEMWRRGLIEASRLRTLFDAIEPDLFRYPALDAASFRRAVEAFLTTVGG
ncbi:MAG TPA: DUF6036 family nucleotidyltransferase [Thermoanaerobaculia bacterium]|nr:DUF6036 family nucleotidyltransferase [Thermoanaerobaculia bacterium]